MRDHLADDWLWRQHFARFRKRAANRLHAEQYRSTVSREVRNQDSCGVSPGSGRSNPLNLRKVNLREWERAEPILQAGGRLRPYGDYATIYFAYDAIGKWVNVSIPEMIVRRKWREGLLERSGNDFVLRVARA